MAIQFQVLGQPGRDNALMARLACRIQPRRLILFHLSDRYTLAQWQDLLAEVRGAFPETYFPETWNMA